MTTDQEKITLIVLYSHQHQFQINSLQVKNLRVLTAVHCEIQNVHSLLEIVYIFLYTA